MEARGSKTLVASEPMRRPSWAGWTLMQGLRVVLLTVLWTGLGMGAGLFCGILGLMVAAAIRHQRAGDGAGLPACRDSVCDLRGRLRAAVEPGADGPGGSRKDEIGALNELRVNHL